MRALTIRQPWAWAVIHAGKTVENRIATKRERRWLKQQLKKETEE